MPNKPGLYPKSSNPYPKNEPADRASDKVKKNSKTKKKTSKKKDPKKGIDTSDFSVQESTPILGKN